MRLTDKQKSTIIRVIRQELGPDVRISLYGSRNDDRRRGGDVDLLLEVKARVALLQKAAVKLHLEQELGLPVDLLVSEMGKESTPFLEIAKAGAVPLTEAA